jgi:tetraacyldisaccharide 4'-kinase
MPFNFYLLRGIRLLLFPFSLLVGLYIWVRNRLYDRGIFGSTSFNLPVICVGNLSVGGTGKSPMTEKLIEWLSPSFEVATLSRGYKRKTKGYVLAAGATTAIDLGDEPMLFHTKFPQIAVAVGEDRVMAIPMLLHDRPQTQVLLLDDAFQHRPLKAGMNLLLTDYSNPYWQDWFLPTGDLRDEKSSTSRAQVIVVTKCPFDLNENTRDRIIEKINPGSGQRVYFSSLRYGKLYRLGSEGTHSLHPQSEVLLVCGIANPGPLKAYLEESTAAYHELRFPDHHIFDIDDLQMIQQKFNAIEAPEKIILTTEKDAVRLVKFGKELQQLPIYVQPVMHQILFNQEAAFRNQVMGFVARFYENAGYGSEEKSR